MAVIGLFNDVLNALVGFLNQALDFVGMEFRLDFEFDLPGIVDKIIEIFAGLGK